MVSSKEGPARIYKTYSAEPSKLKFEPLDVATLIAIGRIIRGTAEIEDCVSWFICTLTKLNEGPVKLMMGKSTISSRIALAKELARTTSDEATTAYESAITEALTDVVSVRNVLAHGRYLGVTGSGLWAFRWEAAIKGQENGSFRAIVHCYNTEALDTWANFIESEIPRIEKVLRIEALRQGPREQDLRPLPAAQSKGPKAKERQHQRGSSQT